MEELKNKLPRFLIDELNKQYGEEITNKIIDGYAENRVVSLRVNTLKSNLEKVCEELTKNNIEYEKVSWNGYDFIVQDMEGHRVNTIKLIRHQGDSAE